MTVKKDMKEEKEEHINNGRRMICALNPIVWEWVFEGSQQENQG